MNIQPKQLSASLEDYLEAILVLSQSGKVARCKNIAEHLQVARASVTGALRSLAEKQLIHYKPYGYITLTEKGLYVAGRIARRHETLGFFFCDVLGADPQIAQQAACLAEHAISPEITVRLTAFLEFITEQNAVGRSIADDFKEYYATLLHKSES